MKSCTWIMLRDLLLVSLFTLQMSCFSKSLDTVDAGESPSRNVAPSPESLMLTNRQALNVNHEEELTVIKCPPSDENGDGQIDSVEIIIIEEQTPPNTGDHQDQAKDPSLAELDTTKNDTSLNQENVPLYKTCEPEY